MPLMRPASRIWQCKRSFSGSAIKCTRKNQDCLFAVYIMCIICFCKTKRLNVLASRFICMQLVKDCTRMCLMPSGFIVYVFYLCSWCTSPLCALA
jgi:hypothetical protein